MLCARDGCLHFLCLLLEPEKGLREIHAHFPAIPTYDGEAESVAKEFLYLQCLILQVQNGRGVSRRRRGIWRNAVGLLLEVALDVSHSFKADEFHFWAVGVRGGERVW